MAFSEWVQKSKRIFRQEQPERAVRILARSSYEDTLSQSKWAVFSKLPTPAYSTSFTGETVHFVVESPRDMRRAQSALGETAVLEWVLEPVDGQTVFWDVGAHYGTYSIVAASKGASVIAIEPHPASLRRLSRNAALNDVALDQYDVALSNVETTREFGSSNTYDSLQRIQPEGDRTVETVRGDSIYPRPDVVKIDVEGHEVRVLEGMRERLQGVERIAVEVHDSKDVTTVKSILDSSGLTTLEIETGRSETYLGGYR